MPVGRSGRRRAPLPAAERRARRWRLLVIVVVVAALATGAIYLGQRKKDDESAADTAALRVAAQLEPQLSTVNLNEAFAAYAAWTVDHTTPEPFPTSPKVDAALLDYSATPSSVTITYQVTTRGLDRCVTGTFSPDAGSSTSIDDCIHR